MLPSAGSERAEVDGTRYRFIVSASPAAPDGTVPLAVTVQRRDRNGAYLRVLGLAVAPPPEPPSHEHGDRRQGWAVKSRHVARLVRLGLASGWLPELPGPPMVLRVSNADVFPGGGPA